MLKKVLCLLVVSLLVSCSGEDKKRDYSLGFKLYKSSFSDLKDWEDDDLYLFDKSVKLLLKRNEYQTNVRLGIVTL